MDHRGWVERVRDILVQLRAQRSPRIDRFKRRSDARDDAAGRIQEPDPLEADGIEILVEQVHGGRSRGAAFEPVQQRALAE